MQRRHSLLARYRGERELADEELESRESEDVERSAEQWDALVLSHLGNGDAHALAEVVAALHRLEAGDYGICLDCEEPIEDARLEALPTAARCISCARIAERRAHN